MNEIKNELQSIVKYDAKIKSLEIIKADNKKNNNIKNFKVINNQIKQLRKKRDAVVDKILSLEGDVCSVLLYRYVNNLTIETTAETMHCSIATVNRLHKKGLYLLSKRGR